MLPLLNFLDSRGREKVRVKEDRGGDRRRGGAGEGRKGREQRGEIGERQREGKGREGIKKAGRGRW